MTRAQGALYRLELMGWKFRLSIKAQDNGCTQEQIINKYVM